MLTTLPLSAEFGLYLDRHGDLSRSSDIVEWAGKVERVSYHSPHLILFACDFIEIRHIENGRLEQIIRGRDIHCTYDNSTYDGAGSVFETTTKSSQEAPHELVPHIHVVIKDSREELGVSAQRVFELVPTFSDREPEGQALDS